MKRLKQKQRGSILAMGVAVLTLMVSFTGISIYIGLQAYGQNELQKACNTAALAGARAMFPGYDAAGAPIIEAGAGTAEARATFATIRANTGILDMIAATGVIGGGADFITCTATGELETGFLSYIGIDSIGLEANGDARALQYSPTSLYGTRVVNPAGLNTPTFMIDIPADFPVTALPENEIYVEQTGMLRGYMVEVCAGEECIDITPSATPINDGFIHRSGNRVYGTAVFNMTGLAGKGSMIRIKDDGVWDAFLNGENGTHFLDSGPLELLVIRIASFPALCPSGDCGSVVPRGLEELE